MLFSGAVFSQEDEKKNDCPEPENKKARDLYEKGTDKKKYKKPERLEFLRKCLEIEPDFAQANWAMAQEIIVRCKLDNSPFEPAVPYMQRAIAVCPKIHSEPYYYIGFHFYEQGKNDSAIFYLNKFIKFVDDDEKKFAKDYDAELYQAKEMVRYAGKEAELKKKIVPFQPKVLKGISTEQSEYLPYISPDETVFLFTRTEPDQSLDKVYHTDKEKEVFTIAHKNKDGTWDRGKPMEYPFNQFRNEGGACLTIDNKHLYYTIYKMEGGAQPNADIYYADYIDGVWESIKKVPNLNHPVYWDSQPTVSADGNTIIFASDRPGGYGKIDLWRIDRDPVTRQWKTPINMGPKINTSGSEKCPFLHSDSETLYFSSDGHFGFGGMDIFYSRKDEKGNWKEPENIGYPINTEGDDAGFFVGTNGQYGYFCSYDEGKVQGKGIGKYDVYYFDLYKEARPEAVTFLKGQLKSDDGEPVINATVEIKNTVNKEKTLAVVDSMSGHFVAAINLKKNKGELIVTSKSPDHAFASQKVKIENETFDNPPKPVTMDVVKAEPGKSVVINNIYYATGAAELYPESFVTLDEFAEYLKENPSMKVEIQGHTDNVGQEAENIKLSEARATNVKKYLEGKGIPSSRISAKGYGPRKPVADNSSLEGRAKNRRTEFLILEK